MHNNKQVKRTTSDSLVSTQALSIHLFLTPALPSPFVWLYSSSSPSFSSSHPHTTLHLSEEEEKRSRDEMSPIITERVGRGVCNSQEKSGKGERRRRKRPISLKQGLIIMSPPMRFLIWLFVRGFNDPATNYDSFDTS